MKRIPPPVWILLGLVLGLFVALLVFPKPREAPAPGAAEVAPVTETRVCRGCNGRGRAWPTMDGRWLPYDYSGTGIIVRETVCGQCGGDGLEEVPAR